MRTLAVETSTLAGGAALLDGDLVVGEYVLDIQITHSERLMATIDRLLVDAGWSVRDLEGLAVSVGPGSFTGLRIGLSTVKGLALALAIPIAAVPTLDAMAAMLPFAALPVVPVLDARKREVYADRKSTRLNSSHITISYAVFCLKKKKKKKTNNISIIKET